MPVIRLFRTFATFAQENPGVWTSDIKQGITSACAVTVMHASALIDLAFEQRPLMGIDLANAKRCIHYIAGCRLIQLGLDGLRRVEQNPPPWLDDILDTVSRALLQEPLDRVQPGQRQGRGRRRPWETCLPWSSRVEADAGHDPASSLAAGACPPGP